MRSCVRLSWAGTKQTPHKTITHTMRSVGTTYWRRLRAYAIHGIHFGTFMIMIMYNIFFLLVDFIVSCFEMGSLSLLRHDIDNWRIYIYISYTSKYTGEMKRA